MTIDVDGQAVEFDPDTVCVIYVDVERNSPPADAPPELRLMMDALTSTGTKADRAKANGRFAHAVKRQQERMEAAPPPTLHTRRLTEGERYEAALRVMVRRAIRRGDVV